MAKALRMAVLLGSLSIATGCASPYVTVAPEPPDQFERLGAATGKACGTLFLYSSAYGFIPVMLNSRVERAYDRALATVPEATALVDVKMQENWFWWVLGMTRCTTITGEAIR